MLLSGAKIKDLGLIENPLDDHFGAASYDISVDRIIVPFEYESRAVRRMVAWLRRKKPSEESVVVPPQGMVQVISRERITLPKDIAGYATVKTRLCQRGILALNIGIVDPEYKGPLSSILINFGKTEFTLRKDEPFLRLTFHRYEPPESIPRPPSPKDDQEYIRDKEEKVLLHFSRTFLNVDQTVKELSDRVFTRWKRGLLLYLPIVGLLWALFAFLVTLGVSRSDRRLPQTEQVREEVTARIRQMQDSANRRMERLEAELRALRGATSQRGPRAAPAPATKDSQP